MKQNNLGIFTPIMISLATISILALVVYQILGKAKTNALTGEAGCVEGNTTACGADYTALEDLEAQNSDTLGWVGIVITAVIGFSVIGIFAFRR